MFPDCLGGGHQRRFSRLRLVDSTSVKLRVTSGVDLYGESAGIRVITTVEAMIRNINHLSKTDI